MQERKTERAREMQRVRDMNPTDPDILGPIVDTDGYNNRYSEYSIALRFLPIVETMVPTKWKLPGKSQRRLLLMMPVAEALP